MLEPSPASTPGPSSARRLWGVELSADAYVWSASADHLSPWRPMTVTHAFITLRDGLDLGHIRFHHLRHRAATVLMGSTDPRTAASRLGHDPSLMMRVYAHAVESRDQASSLELEEGLRAR